MESIVEVDTLVDSRHVIRPSSKQFVAIGQSVQVRSDDIVTGVVRLRIGHEWMLNADLCNELEPMWYLLVHACATALDGGVFEDNLPDNTRVLFSVAPGRHPGVSVVSVKSPDQMQRSAPVTHGALAAGVAPAARQFVDWGLSNALIRRGSRTHRDFIECIGRMEQVF
ncbi:MAG: hypothetical protein ACF8R9_05220 [Phycisphaerales bacterium JB054]